MRGRGSSRSTEQPHFGLAARALGADPGPDVEASTVLLIPKFTRVGAGAFLADDTMVAGYELGAGWLRVEHVRIGKHAFVGNSGMAAPGRKVPRQGLVAVLSAAPRRKKAKTGTSWLGSPPRPLRREGSDADSSRTYAPPTKLRATRAVVEALRAVPVWLHIALMVLVVAAIEASSPTSSSGRCSSAGSSCSRPVRWRRPPPPPPSGSSSVGSAPATTRCDPRSSGATSSRHVRRGPAAPWFARAAIGTLALNL